MTAPWAAPWAAPARSRWFDRPPPADETPREGALRRDLLAAVEWAEGQQIAGAVDPGATSGGHVTEAKEGHPAPANPTEGLVQVGWLSAASGLHDYGHGGRTSAHLGADNCQPVYVVREPTHAEADASRLRTERASRR